jgi:hypothetical protein
LVVSSPWFKPPGGFVPDSPISETLMGLLELNHASVPLADPDYQKAFGLVSNPSPAPNTRPFKRNRLIFPML